MKMYVYQKSVGDVRIFKSFKYLSINYYVFIYKNVIFLTAPPYWVEGGIKQYYVSKKCATRAQCEAIKAKTMPYCTYLWYQDWKCAECCLGDRCNFYITVTTNFMLTFILIYFQKKYNTTIVFIF